MFFVVSPIKPYRVPSTSMAPTLVPGDYFMVDKRFYENRMPKRGDVVVFLFPGSKDRIYVKRVVGVAGDRVIIKDTLLSINSKNVREPYAIRITGESSGNKGKNDFGPETVSPESFFVLGDNRPHSVN